MLPIRFEKVRAFYRLELGDPQVVSTVSREQNGRVLTLVSRRSGDGWKRAVIREGAMGTEIEVTPILGRSRDVEAAVDKIDDTHLEAIRR